MTPIENPQDLVGKTIASIGISDSGALMLSMTDGSRVLLVGDDGHGIAFFGTSVLADGVVDSLIPKEEK